jgi:hypothetical protein
MRLTSHCFRIGLVVLALCAIVAAETIQPCLSDHTGTCYEVKDDQGRVIKRLQQSPFSKDVWEEKNPNGVITNRYQRAPNNPDVIEKHK